MTAGKHKNRIDIIDAVRGLCIFLMVAFHFGYDLVAYGGFPQELIYNPLLDALQPLFAGVFIFVSGVSCRLSRSNLRRGALMFGAGWVVTLVTWLMGIPAWFGILHFLGAAAILFGVYERVAPSAKAGGRAAAEAAARCAVGGEDGAPRHTNSLNSGGAAGRLMSATGGVRRRADVMRVIVMLGCAVLFVVFYVFVHSRAFDVRGLFWLGFSHVDFYSSDYFPILPWIFIYIAGTCAGAWVAERRLPMWFYTLRVPVLAACGRRTMLIYLLHQPVLYAIVMVLF